MNKTVIALILIAFVLCCVVGFFAASAVNPENKPGQKTPIVAGNIPQQTTLLLVHVNDISEANPTLITIWALFYYPGDNPSLMFQQVYPSSQASVDATIQSQMTLSAKGDVASQFFGSLQDQYRFSWNNYVVVDQQSMQNLTGWLPGMDSTAFLTTPLGRDDLLQAASNDQDYLKQLCSKLSDPQARDNLIVPWDQVLQEHLLTDLGASAFSTVWSHLIANPAPATCNVFTP
ncbi:MAG TPA: hypothetical protein VMC62_00485 [Longilinea sp.]|nr:hypothetical protein [Longilinea sp.]